MTTWFEEHVNNSIGVCYYLNILPDRNKVIGFDLDHTLIKPKKNVFPTSIDDWIYVFKNVKSKLIEYHQKGYNIVVFTNQSGFKNKKELIMERIKQFLDDNSDIPISVFISTSNDFYRKPNLGMWECFIKNIPNFNKEESLYIGDAAGRVYKKELKLKKDFSSSDVKFAYNIGIKFNTPEEFFMDVMNDDRISYINLGGLCIEQMKELKTIHKYTPQNPELFSNKLELVILVGYPGSGKSTFKNKYIEKGYLDIEKDKIKIKQKYMSMTKNAINTKKNILIDSTNPDVSSRKLFIDLCKKNDYEIKCIYFNISRNLSEHLNNFRMKLSNGIKKKIESVVYNVYDKKFVLPNIKEGFNSIINVNFVPEFKCQKDSELFYQYS